jgi:hypothetical protein
MMNFGFQSGRSGGIIPTTNNAYLSGFSTIIQTALAGQQPLAMEIENVPTSFNLHIDKDQDGRSTLITADVDGIFNLQFSAQIEKGAGGGTEEIDIWINVNGAPEPYSNTRLTLANNGHFVVASWNWYVNLLATEFVQIMFSATDTNIALVYNGSPNPAIPSIIMTISKLGEY